MCIRDSFNADKVRALLGIPEQVIVVGLLPIGYPDAEPPSKNRLSLDDIVMHERWSG